MLRTTGKDLIVKDGIQRRRKNSRSEYNAYLYPSVRRFLIKSDGSITSG